MSVLEQAVNLGEVKFGREDDVLVCFGLGSCVGVVMYDPDIGLAGMAHVVLPKNNRKQSAIVSESVIGSHSPAEVEAPAKYADTGIAFLLESLLNMGAKKTRLRVKLAGGASVLAVPIFNNAGGLEIGQRNVIAIEEILDDLKIPIIAKDVGGNKGRTMRFYTEDGRVEVSTFGSDKKLL